jgi:hypothetical protein
LAVRTLRPWFLPPWWDANVARAGALWELQSQRIGWGAGRKLGGFNPLYVHAAGAPDVPLAQCLAKRTGPGLVIEQLILADDADVVWVDAMQAVLAHLGPGSYRYGHNWSLEPSRDEELRSLEGVVVELVRPITVHAVENGLWASDTEWLAGISTNVKRNLRRARDAEPPVVTRWRRGRSALLNLRGFVDMRGATMRRLGTPTNRIVEMVRRGLAWMAGPQGLVVGIASAGKQSLAAVAGYEVGPNFYYAMGGSLPDNNGASWTLMVEAILEWRRKYPAGRFVLGYLDETLEGVQRDGLLRQRQSVRKSDFPTALVDFVYRP